MDDKELLKLAAKAAGIRITGWAPTPYGEAAIADGDCEPLWNPLTDDGDALRLAVKLGIEPQFNHDIEVVAIDTNPGSLRAAGVITEEYNNDPYAATRRAIVRAAAEIGKGM